MISGARGEKMAGTFNRSSAVIVDLDGTLVDSVGDITSSINAVLAVQRLRSR